MRPMANDHNLDIHLSLPSKNKQKQFYSYPSLFITSIR